jgi:hypothetical protein
MSGRRDVRNLRLDAIHAMAQRLLAQDTLPQIPQAVAGVDVDAFDRKVVRDFFRRDGSLKEIPAAQKKLQAVLRHIVRAFHPERRYTEKHVNQVLSRFHPDTASLRRYLISYKLMARDADGAHYWRVV